MRHLSIGELTIERPSVGRAIEDLTLAEEERTSSTSPAVKRLSSSSTSPAVACPSLTTAADPDTDPAASPGAPRWRWPSSPPLRRPTGGWVGKISPPWRRTKSPSKSPSAAAGHVEQPPWQTK